MKLLLSIPVTTTDLAVYIISGITPLESTIQKRALTLFGNISHLTSSSIEKRKAHRKLKVKGQKRIVDFVATRELYFKYDLPQPLDMLNDPPGKEKWKKIVSKQVNDYWTGRLAHQSTIYANLKPLHTEDYYYGQRHPVIQTIGNAKEIPRIGTKLKLVTGTYIL